MLPEALAVVVGALIAVGAALRGWSWWLRERAVRRVPPEQVRRQARGVSLVVMVSGRGVLPGMNPARNNRTRGDLIVTDDRLLITSGRGTLVDLSAASAGTRLAAVRCPGPGKLVVEGDRGGKPGADAGRYRIETLLPDADQWVAALQRFV